MTKLDTIDGFLDDVPRDAALSELMLRRSLNEEWFSDTLSWLLDPKGSHEYGVMFARKFLRCIGQKRSDEAIDYTRRATHLKFGKGGRGHGYSSFNIGNATTIREFYLARTTGRAGTGALDGSRYCDVVFADLDSDDGIFAVIENKLFTANHPGQLAEYLRTVEERYKRADCREYVFLTLDGREPERYDGESDKTYRRWVNVSWVDDILPILEEIGDNGHEDIRRLVALLSWLRELLLHGERTEVSLKDVEDFRTSVIEASAECLHEELARLLADGKGSWDVEKRSNRSVRLVHNYNKARYLYVEMLPNFSVTLQTRRRTSGRARFEKILVPFGATSDQVYNLLDIAARDLYYRHFNDPQDYLGNKRRLTATVTPKKKEHRPVFDFLHDRRFELKVMLTLSDHAWEAAQGGVES